MNRKAVAIITLIAFVILVLIALVYVCYGAEDPKCMYDCQYVKGYSFDYCRKLCSY